MDKTRQSRNEPDMDMIKRNLHGPVVIQRREWQIRRNS